MRAVALCSALSLVLAGCTGESGPSTDVARGAPAGVQAACGRCHATPPVDALPRELWPRVIDNMLAVPVPDGTMPLSPDEIAAAKRHYATAPVEFDRAAPAEVETTPRFSSVGFTPPGPEEVRLPAVAHVAFAELWAPGRTDLIVCEQRSRSLMRLALWAPPEARTLRPALRDLNYPVRSTFEDVTGDGQRDLLIAAIGGMEPTNDVRGSVLLFVRTAARFDRVLVAGGLGRPVDVRPADFDGDGDVDLVVPAFGWLGPGRLLLLENRGFGGSFEYAQKELDDRDGFLDAAVTDLDGDGRPDIATVVSQEHEEVLAFLNRGELRFERRTLYRAPHASWGFTGLELVDLDADGDVDVLTSNGDSLDYNVLKPYHGVQWLEQRGPLEFAPRRIAAMHGCARAIPADVDGDGDLDVVATAYMPLFRPEEWEQHGLDSVIWIERDGDAWKKWSIERHRLMHPTVAATDWNGDGKIDLAVGNSVWIGEDGQPYARADTVTLFQAR